MIAGVNVSDCFWYQLTRVILELMTVKRLFVFCADWLDVVLCFNVVFQGCRPYSVAECEHYMNGTRPPCNKVPTPQCVQQCESSYKLSYQDDKHFGKFTALLYVEEILCIVNKTALWTKLS